MRKPVNRRTYRAPDPLLTIAFDVPDGQAGRRMRCDRCRCPVMEVTLDGRSKKVNPDGSMHSTSCIGGARRYSISRLGP